jgi:hypothetical protein
VTVELVTAPVVCSWCGKQLGMYAPTEISEQNISHGICAECAQRIGGKK